MFDNQGINLSFSGIRNRLRIDRLGWCNGRVCIVVMLTGTRVLKAILVEQFVGVCTKVSSSGCKFVNELAMIKFGSKLLRFGTRIGNESLIVKFFGR